MLSHGSVDRLSPGLVTHPWFWGSARSVSAWGLSLCLSQGDVGGLHTCLHPSPGAGHTLSLPARSPEGLTWPLGAWCCHTRVAAPALLSAVSFRRAALLSMPASHTPSLLRGFPSSAAPHPAQSSP